MSDPNRAGTGWTQVPSARNGKSNMTRTLAFGLPVVLLVVLGVVLVSTHASSTPDAATKAGQPARPSPSAVEDRFVLPATVAGIPLSTDPKVTATAKTLLSHFGGVGVVGAYESSADPQDVFLLGAIPQVVTDPSTTVQSAIPELTSLKELTLGKLVSYSAGTQGGVMYCATATLTGTTASIPFGVCAVADSGGIIIALYLNHSGAETAAVVTTTRAQVEK